MSAVESAPAPGAVLESEPAAGAVLESTPAGLVACPECGKTVKAQGLGTHRSKAHGVAGQHRAAKPRTGRARKPQAKKPAAPDAADLVVALREFVAEITAEIEEAKSIVEAMGGALGSLRASRDALRTSLVKSRQEVARLRKGA